MQTPFVVSGLRWGRLRPPSAPNALTASGRRAACGRRPDRTRASEDGDRPPATEAQVPPCARALGSCLDLHASCGRSRPHMAPPPIGASKRSRTRAACSDPHTLRLSCALCKQTSARPLAISTLFHFARVAASRRRRSRQRKRTRALPRPTPQGRSRRGMAHASVCRKSAFPSGPPRRGTSANVNTPERATSSPRSPPHPLSQPWR